MKPFVLQHFSVFVRNIYMLHATAKYLYHYNLCYNVYFVSDETDLTNAMEIDYGGSIPTINLRK